MTFTEKTFVDCSLLPHQRMPHPKFHRENFRVQSQNCEICESFLPQKFSAVWQLHYSVVGKFIPTCMYCLLAMLIVYLQILLLLTKKKGSTKQWLLVQMALTIPEMQQNDTPQSFLLQLSGEQAHKQYQIHTVSTTIYVTYTSTVKVCQFILL